MSDLISLECQNCGAPLQVDKDLIKSKCPYCDHEFLVKESDGVMLERHNRCPVCHRNDLTRKVSSIMTGSAEKRAFFACPAKPIRPQDTHRLTAPKAPIENSLKSINQPLGIFIATSFLALSSLLCGLSDPNENSFAFFFLIVFGAAAFIFFRRYRSGKQVNQETASYFKNQLDDYQQQVQDYNQAVTKHQQEQEELYQKWIENWQAAVEKWNKMYYCERDDCVFVPGSSQYAPLKDIEKFCYRKD